MALTETNKNTFKKLDLHIHTPQSVCYSDKSVSPEKIVDAALSADLDAIGITDHNTVDAIADIRKIAKNRNLYVFPGVELSTSGGHFTVLFDIDASIEMLETFLQALGILPEDRGDATVLIDLPIETVFEIANEYGGLIIAAHIDRWPSGFVEAKTSRRTKMNIHGSEYLSALEITVSTNKDRWNRGKVRGYPKKYPCIQSSDAHAPDEIGRRFVNMKIETVNIPGLHSAFVEAENSIVFPAGLTEE